MDYWYTELIKPELSPPDWIFAPIWIFLYFTIVLSLFLMASSKVPICSKIVPFGFFAFQLFLNLSWSPVFFDMHNIDLAFYVICLLFVTLIATVVTFYRVNKTAAIVLIPYLLWVFFAAYLNYELMILN